MTHGVNMAAQAASGSDSTGQTQDKPHFATGKNRGDAYSFMMAVMMGKLLGSNASETKAQKIQEKRNFLKDALETAMKQIQDFGGLEEWLDNLEQHDKGYSPAMQAWIKNEASQMENFKDKSADKAIAAADKNIKSDLSALKSMESSLKFDEHSVSNVENTISSTEEKFKDAIDATKAKFTEKIDHLKSEIGHHWYDWLGKNKGIYVAIGVLYAAEGVALGAEYTGEGFALGGLYTALGLAKMAVASDKANIKADKKQLHKDQGKLSQAENALRSAQNNLMGILENNGKSQGDGAKSGLQTYKSEQSKLQAVENTLASLMGDISQNSGHASSKSSH